MPKEKTIHPSTAVGCQMSARKYEPTLKPLASVRCAKREAKERKEKYRA